MATIEHAPIREALNRVRRLSADEEAQRLAFVRERALRDELSFLKEAREEGREEGRQEAARETAGHLLRLGRLNEDEIAAVTGLTPDVVRAMRAGDPTGLDPSSE